jgi:hypothetical protein
MRSEELTVSKTEEIDCCLTAETADPKSLAILSIMGTGEAMTEQCLRCGEKGKPLSRKTVLLMLKPEFLEQAMSGNYSFCAERNCPVVYFDETGQRHFTAVDLRIRVGLKVKEDPIPLCYCFGFDESHIREEIAQTGATTVPERISKLIREGLCACDTRNPAGVCCLGEVNKAVRRLDKK